MASYRNKCGRWSLIYHHSKDSVYKTVSVILHNAYDETIREASFDISPEEMQDLRYLIDRALHWREVDKDP